jgi:predicted transcriptional regulator
MIGYLPKGYDPKTEAKDVQDSVPYRMFTDCFIRNMKRAWTVEDLADKLKTTKPTIYRHLNKLKSIDILEEVDVDKSGERKKGYRIRYGDLSKAWNFTEANVEMAMDSTEKQSTIYSKWRVRSDGAEPARHQAVRGDHRPHQGSRYRIVSKTAGETPMTTISIFKGYTSFGHDSALSMQPTLRARASRACSV